MDLEKYYDIYDISDFDMLDALRGYSEEEFDDAESLRTLKILAARFCTVRKLFLSSLLALDANGDTNDLLRWTTAVEALRSLNKCTQRVYDRLRTVLGEEESKSCAAIQTPSNLNQNLTQSSLPITSDSQKPFNTKQRALAISDAKAQFTLDRHQRLTSKTSTSSRGIRQSPGRLT